MDERSCTLSSERDSRCLRMNARNLARSYLLYSIVDACWSLHHMRPARPDVNRLAVRMPMMSFFNTCILRSVMAITKGPLGNARK